MLYMCETDGDNGWLFNNVAPINNEWTQVGLKVSEQLVTAATGTAVVVFDIPS